MKPNIFFITLDALRSDKCHGPKKSSITPNLDSLISKGIYFNQTISSSDQTGTSLASIFNGSFPINSGITQWNFNSDSFTLFDLLQKNDYKTFAFIPDITFFLDLTKNFNERISYTYYDKHSWKRIFGGLGDQLIHQIKSIKDSPWIFYTHLMDTKPNPTYVPPEFDLPQFGDTNYDRLMSAMDPWIGKIMDAINFENTLVILSSDHGEYITVTGKSAGEIPKTQKIMRQGKKIFPFLEPIGLRIFLKIRNRAILKTKQKFENILSPYEQRQFNDRAGLDLYDELVNVPLLFVGSDFKPSKIIPNLVRHVDVFPTILEFLDMKFTKKIDGQSLINLIKNNEIEEKPAYIETGIRINDLTGKVPNPSSRGNVIGLRTSDFKYFRSRKNSKEYVHLYDLKIDPLEETNLAELNIKKVQEMEDLLSKMTINSESNVREISKDEQERVEDELRKLGYI